jgi:hypothetical protein
MISELIPHPRQAVIAELEQHKMQFFAAGKSIQRIAIGHSGVDPAQILSKQRKQLQFGRAGLAPTLRAHADAGRTIQAAARLMKIKLDRARLIAKENGIVYQERQTN